MSSFEVSLGHPSGHVWSSWRAWDWIYKSESHLNMSELAGAGGMLNEISRGVSIGIAGDEVQELSSRIFQFLRVRKTRTSQQRRWKKRD